jgi:hypothetical protein
MDDLRLNAIPTLDPKRSTYSAIWSISRVVCQRRTLARWWHSVTWQDGLRWVLL